jgi:acetyl esterase
VVSLRTRLAPEVKFPAAHDDAFALYQWARAHMREWGADPTRVALAGEGAGADLALSTALQARDRATAGQPIAVPDHLLLITPVTGTELNTPSMSESGRSRPLSRRTVDWAQWMYAQDNLDDPRIDILARNDFQQMPPTTFVLAEIDPLRSGAEMLAAKFTAAGIPNETRVFPGTTHDFFGLGQQVPEAAAAEDFAAARLKTAFYRPPMPVIAGPVRARRPARRQR